MGGSMKILLYIYEKMSGLKINFDNRSEIVMVSSDEKKHYGTLT
jgi:hypothetical protein